MVSLVISEEDFARLSAETREELLSFFGQGKAPIGTASVQPSQQTTGHSASQLAGQAWDPDGDTPYPLNPREAKELIRGLSPSSRAILKAFCQNSDGELGRADLEELLAVSGHKDPQRLMKAIPGITRRLRTVTNNREAWLIDWFDEDWERDDAGKTWTKGAYFIPAPAVQALCQAFGT